MKINDIILESGMSAEQQVEASQVYAALLNSNDPYLKRVAYYFQATRNDVKHRTVDSAQSAAEAMVRREMAAKTARGEPNKEINRAYEKKTGESITQLVRDMLAKKTRGGQAGNQNARKYDNQPVKGKTAKELLSPLSNLKPDLRGPTTAATSGFEIGKRIAQSFNAPAGRS